MMMLVKVVNLLSSLCIGNIALKSGFMTLAVGVVGESDFFFYNYARMLSLDGKGVRITSQIFGRSY
jgi:hypothetical protein